MIDGGGIRELCKFSAMNDSFMPKKTQAFSKYWPNMFFFGQIFGPLGPNTLHRKNKSGNKILIDLHIRYTM